MNEIPFDVTAWQHGHTLQQFVDGMRYYQPEMRRRLEEVRLTALDVEHFATLTASIRVLVTTEDWCGDSALNLPILACIVEAAPSMAMRVFIRNKNPELRAYYRSRDIMSIPVFTFLDADFSEIGTWVERPQAARAPYKAWEATHPELVTIQKSEELSRQEKRAKLTELYWQKMLDMEAVYAESLQAETVREIKELLAKVAQATG